MRVILALFAVLAFMGSIGILSIAKGAVHEIEGLIILLISAVFLTGAVIVEVINRFMKEMKKK